MMDGTLQYTFNRLDEEVGGYDFAYAKKFYQECTTDNPVHRLIENFLRGYNSVLDAGCGPGQWAIVLARHNKYVTGIDGNKDRAKIAQIIADAMSIKNVKFEIGDIFDLKYKDNAFDLIFCKGVLYLLATDRGLGEMNRVLKPGGIICFDMAGFGRMLDLVFRYCILGKDKETVPSGRFSLFKNVTWSIIKGVVYRYVLGRYPPNVVTWDSPAGMEKQLHKIGFRLLISGSPEKIVTYLCDLSEASMIDRLKHDPRILQTERYLGFPRTYLMLAEKTL